MPSSDQIAQAAGFSRAARSLGIQIEHVQRRHCFRMTPTSRRRRAERCPQPLTAISLLDDVQLRGTRMMCTTSGWTARAGNVRSRVTKLRHPIAAPTLRISRPCPCVPCFNAVAQPRATTAALAPFQWSGARAAIEH